MALTENQKKRNEKNRKYWADREAEQLKHYLKDELEYSKRIKQIHEDMMDAVQSDIDRFYARYAKKEGITIAEARKRADKLDMDAYRRKAKKYVREKDFSKTADEEMRIYNLTMKVNRLELLKANIGLDLVSGYDELDKYMAEILEGRTIEEITRQAGILGRTVLNNAEKAHAIVNASFHNATFSNRVWMYQDLLKAELSKLLQIGLIQGKNPRVLAAELRKKFEVSEVNAERLMRTELARVQTEAQKQSFERNGFKQYTFITNSGCCEICAALDGEHFNVGEMMPGKNAPPMHPNCRCSTSAWMDREEFDKWLEEQNKLLKTIENSNENDIIKMYRKGNTYRKTSEEGNQIIDMATYHKITNPAIRKGADIRIAKDDVLKRLNDQGATAVTYGNIIFFRPDATVSDVLEEVYHFEQNRRGLNDQYDSKQRMIMNEIDAKQYLLSVIDKYRIPPEETELTRKQLSSYKKQMEDMKERGEWRD